MVQLWCVSGGLYRFLILIPVGCRADKGFLLLCELSFHSTDYFLCYAEAKLFHRIPFADFLNCFLGH